MIAVSEIIVHIRFPKANELALDSAPKINKILNMLWWFQSEREKAFQKFHFFWPTLRSGSSAKKKAKRESGTAWITFAISLFYIITKLCVTNRTIPEGTHQQWLSSENHALQISSEGTRAIINSWEIAAIITKAFAIISNQAQYARLSRVTN